MLVICPLGQYQYKPSKYKIEPSNLTSVTYQSKPLHKQNVIGSSSMIGRGFSQYQMTMQVNLYKKYKMRTLLKKNNKKRYESVVAGKILNQQWKKLFVRHY